MAKATLEFNLNNRSEELAFRRASKATDAYIALFKIAEEVFRPARKHGYDNINSPVMNIEEWPEHTHQVVSELEDMFYQVLRDCEVNLDELE